jgi:serine/threonine protein kinase
LASTFVHPRCVFVLAADEKDGRPYIVMELMPGRTLEDLVRECGPLPVEEAVPKILDVIDGLQEAHHFGVIHRDVKPSNCLLESDGRVKVGDFGLAKALAANVRLTRTGSFLGTPLYASPEQVKSEPLTPQTDVYSAAATFYFLLAGKAPFECGNPAATLARIASEDVPSLRGTRPDIPEALDRVVLRGLERKRERRYKDL